jgi:hypothetical protein
MPATSVLRASSARTAQVQYRSGPSKTWLKIKNLQAPGVLGFKGRDELA